MQKYTPVKECVTLNFTKFTNFSAQDLKIYLGNQPWQ